LCAATLVRRASFGRERYHHTQTDGGKETLEVEIFPTKILLATDGSEEAELAARTAIDLAESTGSELHVVYVERVPKFLDGPGTIGYDHLLYDKHEEEAREVLRKLVWQVQVGGGAVAGAHLRMGGVADEVVGLAEELGVGLIVMGSRGHGGIRRALMGSVSDFVVRHAHCPVMIVRAQGLVG
jgi:nucleotide-binding universal stress UspA family protein